MNIQYFWFRDQKTLQNFIIAWKARQENLTDYLMKNNSANQQKRVCPIYIYRYINATESPAHLTSADPARVC